MDQFSIKQIGHRCETDMGMWQHVHTPARFELDWTDVIEKNKRSNKPAPTRR